MLFISRIIFVLIEHALKVGFISLTWVVGMKPTSRPNHCGAAIFGSCTCLNILNIFALKFQGLWFKHKLSSLYIFLFSKDLSQNETTVYIYYMDHTGPRWLDKNLNPRKLLRFSNSLQTRERNLLYSLYNNVQKIIWNSA